jgi:hypothetical protein
LLLTFLAQRQPTAHFLDMLPKVRQISPRQSTTANMVVQGREDQYFDDAMKRILVLDGISLMSGRSGLLASDGGTRAEWEGKSQNVLAESP